MFIIRCNIFTSEVCSYNYISGTKICLDNDNFNLATPLNYCINKHTELQYNIIAQACARDDILTEAGFWEAQTWLCL